MKILTLALLLSAFVFAQDKKEELVTVPKQYVSQEGLAKVNSAQSIAAISSWAGIGKEVGEATRDALNSVVDVSDKFSRTDVGRFVLVMVAWKIIGHQIMGVVLGIPIFLSGIGLWIWVTRRFFFPRRVLVKEDTTTKTKEWKVTQYQFEGDGRGFTGAALLLSIIAWCIVCLIIIFGVGS